MMGDDERCSAEDIGGNLGGPCACSKCATERVYDELKNTVDDAVARGVRAITLPELEREIAIKDVPSVQTGRISYDGVKSLPPRQDEIDRSRYVYEGPNGTPRPKPEYSPNERLRAPLADKLKPLIPRDLPAGSCPCSRCQGERLGVVLAAPPALQNTDVIVRAASMPLQVVTVEIKRRKCVCGVDLDAMVAEGKIGHACSALRPELEFTIPAYEGRELQLEQFARDFAEASPSYYKIAANRLKVDHERRRETTAQFRRAALQYAAEYLAKEAERDGGDYHEAIAELRDPTIQDVK